MVVQHNLTAMNANRMLGITQGTMSKTTEKLSSGYKINRAADDAAGLSISEKMRKQIRGLTQASLNAEDGISSVQTAEGALNEVQDMLQRMNELATKASNGTMSETDRTYIQNEIDQLVTEIDRVSETTKFNETYLLKGDEGTKTVNMNAHDAGLKGKLVDNGDGTATFTMDELKNGDTVTIGGKTYNIVDETDNGVEKMSIADMKELIKNVVANADEKAVTDKFGAKITIDGTVYTSDVTSGKWSKDGAAAATITAGEIENLVIAGSKVEIEVTGDLAKLYSGKFETETTVNNVQSEIDTVLSAVDDSTTGTKQAYTGTSIKINDNTYTFEDKEDGTGTATWKDQDGNDVTADIKELLKAKEGDKVSISYITGTAANDYVRNFKIPDEEELSTAEKTDITAAQAYELARQELYQANRIGDTEGTADVVFGEPIAEEDAITDLANVNDAIKKVIEDKDGKLAKGDTITIDDKTYTYTVKAGTSNVPPQASDYAWHDDEGTVVTDTTKIKANAGDRVEISVKKDEDASKTYNIETTRRDVQDLLDDVLANSATLKGTLAANDSITINGETYTYGTANDGTTNTWCDEFGDKAEGTKAWNEAKALDDGDIVEFNIAGAVGEYNGKYVIPSAADKDAEPVITDAAAAGEAQNVFTITTGSAEVSNTLNFNLHVGADADMTNKINVQFDSMGAANLGIKGLNVKDNDGMAATYAVDAIADALQKVSTQRSALGAIQNRLEHTIKNLDNVVENTTAAESQIRDTDMATEMVKYSNNNILSQAGQSMLAQANQSNQGVLSLLG